MMKIAALLIIAVLAVTHLIFREYPFGGTGQTILDIIIVIALAVTVGSLLSGKALNEQNKAAPPKTADQKPNDIRDGNIEDDSEQVNEKSGADEENFKK